MSLQFILGGSGSGKTHRLYSELIQLSIKQPDTQYIAIVPEQFTMQTQKEIVNLHPHHGVINIDIVSFGRLAYRVFEELAITNPQVLDDMGKSMVLRKVAANKKKELVLYKEQLSKTGFISQIKSMLSEMYQYGVTPKMLKEQIPETISPVLGQKITDISVIYQGFKDYIKDKYITTEEILDVLCRVLPRSELMKNSVITLDGYTGFTPVQYRLLELFLRYSKKVIVTVTIDPSENMSKKSGIQELFHMSRQMIWKLNELAKATQTARDQDILLMEHPAVRYRRKGTQQDTKKNDLDFLEQNLYRYKKETFKNQPSSIQLIQALNPSEEISYVIYVIEKLIRDKGLRYRDMAVITGDLGSYSNEIIHQFQMNHVPYFLDDKKSILKNPMVELIRAAIDIIQRDFSYESIFRYLRTGLITKTEDKEKLDRMENYVIAMGIRGFKKWDSTWEGWYRGGKELNLEELNAFREEIMVPLRKLREAFRKEDASAKTMTVAVTTFLMDNRIEEKMLSYEARFKEQEKYHLAKEYSQVYGLVMELFERLSGLLGEEQVSRREYADILDAGFSEIKVGLIPASVDRVVVGDITRTRLDHIKVVLFVGVNDGIVPVKKEKSSLFTDRERDFLGNHEIELAPTAREEGCRQRFYLYLLLTKPELELVLSYSAMDSSGKSMRPSTLIGELKKLFPTLTETVPDKKRVPLSRREAKEYLTKGLREYGKNEQQQEQQDNGFLELVKYYLLSADYKKEVERLVQAAFYTYEEKGIGKIAAKALYGEVLSGSVTRMEQYASCAYSHFLHYGLELMERQEYELAAMDIGNLFHDSIDLCFTSMKEEGRDLRELSEDERKALVHSCVTKVTEEYGNTILKSSARNAYLAGKVERITDRTVWALTEQLKKGDFTPVGFEVSFSAADHLKAMRIPISDKEAIHLRGRIDRLDMCEDEEAIYVKVIDYKSGSTAFDLSALYYGLQLQLVVYMDAAIEMEERQQGDKPVVPAGIFYYNINDPIIDKKGNMTEAEISQDILKQLRMNGLVNTDLNSISHLDHEIENESDVIPVAMKKGMINESRSSVAGGKRFQALRTFVQEKLKAEGREILDGEVAIKPYKQGNRSACDYCPYHAVCGFDLKTEGHGYRKFKALKSEEIWPRIEGEEKGGDESGD